MISFSDLRAHPTIPEFSGEDPNNNFTVEYIGRAIKEQMNKYGLPVSVQTDEIKMGNIFNSSKTPCVVISNSEHYNYCKYCISVRRQGILAFVTINLYGSDNIGLALEIERNAPKGGVLGFVHKNLFKGNEQKLLAEKDYYAILDQSIISILGGK